MSLILEATTSTSGFPTAQYGPYVSDDGGATFAARGTWLSLLGENRDIQKMVWATDRWIFAGMKGASGASQLRIWTWASPNLSSGAPVTSTIPAITYTGSYNSTVRALTYSPELDIAAAWVGSGTFLDTVWYSTDRGQTWVQGTTFPLNSTFTGGFMFEDGGRLYLIGDVSGRLRGYYSTDGATWTEDLWWYDNCPTNATWGSPTIPRTYSKNGVVGILEFQDKLVQTSDQGLTWSILQQSTLTSYEWGPWEWMRGPLWDGQQWVAWAWKPLDGVADAMWYRNETPNCDLTGWVAVALSPDNSLGDAVVASLGRVAVSHATLVGVQFTDDRGATWSLADHGGALRFLNLATDYVAPEYVGGGGDTVDGSYMGSGETIPSSGIPQAAFTPSPDIGVVGTVVQLDARQSVSPGDLPLTYSWRFISVPIGSMAEREGFRSLEEGLSAFSPDKVGEYIVGLSVSNGYFESEEMRSSVSIRATLVPHGRSLVPDGKWVWSYLRDAWSEVEGREFFETLWSALIQIVGAEMLKLYQVDFNKSIRDIQELYQRRWLKYEPKLSLKYEDLSLFLGYTGAGNDASTGAFALSGLGIITGANEMMVVRGSMPSSAAGKQIRILYSRTDANVGEYDVVGLNSAKTGFRVAQPFPANPTTPETSDLLAADVDLTFDFGSTTWLLSTTGSRRRDDLLSDLLGLPVYHQGVSANLGDVQAGDVIVYPSGPNAGTYQIIEKSGSYVVVDRAPSGSNTPATASVRARIYRPVGFELVDSEQTLTDIVSIPLSSAPDLGKLAPGRVLVLNGQSYTIIRSAVDTNQRVPTLVLTVDRQVMTNGLRSLNWRVPNTLISKEMDFEQLGVSTGDVLKLDISSSGVTTGVALQVIGVDRNRLGFVLSDEIQSGEVPPIPTSFYLTLAEGLGVDGAEVSLGGSLIFSGSAKKLLTEMGTHSFKSTYWNKELKAEEVEFAIAGRTFTVEPRAIIRNNLVPVEEALASIPLLQEYIRQPTTVQRDGKVYMLKSDEEFELPRVPVQLTENFHYIIDGETALDETFTFRGGSDILEISGDFLDRSIVAGDTLIIENPVELAGEYSIVSVLSSNKVLLDKKIPEYLLSTYAVGRILVKRKRPGRFLRFIPGLFSGKKPAPDRLWAEVSFFDNSDSIEDNFGLLVALTRKDLAEATNGVSYRQAVAGLMYAYTRGSAVDHVRLGAQILLGLPFTEHRGIIRSIENNYRLDAYGVPVLGRVLIEDLDDDDAPVGTLRIYTYPVDAASDLAGLDVNPSTKATYAVGDRVDAFSSLAKGVQILDYKSADFSKTSDIFQLQQFHSIRVRVNDNVFSSKEIQLVSSFLRKITPSYVAIFVAKTTQLLDALAIADHLRMRLRIPTGAPPSITDTIGGGLAVPLMFDVKTFGNVYPIRFDDGMFWIRRTGRDLRTFLDGTKAIEVVAGGLLTQRAGEEFVGPLCEPGDKLAIFGGINAGLYTIATLTDTRLTVSDGPVYGFQNLDEQHYAILRPMKPLIVSGAGASTVSGNNQVSAVGAYFRTRLVMPGDWLVFDNSPVRHVILSVDHESLTVFPAPAATNVSVGYKIFRSLFLSSYGFQIQDGTVPSLFKALAEIGDELVIDRQDRLRLTIIDPKNGKTVPPLLAGTYNAELQKRGRVGAFPTFDFMNQVPEDIVSVSLMDNLETATCSAGSAVVSFSSLPSPATSGIRPGDVLTLLSGANAAVDVGYGPGVYPIAEVSPTNLTLSVALTSAGAAQWKITRRR